jgi:uncharacterized protein YkwD
MKSLKTIITVVTTIAIITPLAFAQSTFPDVNNTHNNFDSIEYVALEGIVNGYPDGTFKPDNTINRAEFTKIIIEATNPSAQIGTNCFPDVTDEWFASYVCGARAQKIIDGYPDGTFKPSQKISFVEAAKIISLAFEYDTSDDTPWYKTYVETLSTRASIPLSIESFNHPITRGEMAEMIFRLKTDPQKDSHTYQTLETGFLEETNTSVEDNEDNIVDDIIDELFEDNIEDNIDNIDDIIDAIDKETETDNTENETTNENTVETESEVNMITNVDMQQVRTAWLKLFNDERATLGRHELTYDSRLDATALEWSQFMADENEVTHKRPGQTEYYDYNLIKNWFSDRGLNFANVNRVTFSENIGMGVYSCNADDCTQALIESINSTFDFYMGEKNKEYQPHYNSMTNQYFNTIGLGIHVKDNRYYLTVHYATEIL